MTVSLWGLGMALVSGTVLLLLFHVLRVPLRRWLGVSGALAFSLLGGMRLLFPVEILLPVEVIPSVSVPLPEASSGMVPLLLGVWGAGALLCLGLFFRKYGTMSRRLARHGRTLPLCEAAVSRYASQNLQVLYCPEVSVPLGVGLFRKRIFLPREDYSQEELSVILRHESTHFQKGDLWIKFLLCVFCCLFWWNPAVYLLQKDVEQLLELRCDASVTRNLTKAEKNAYLTVLLNAVKHAASREDNTLSFVGAQLFSTRRHSSLAERFREVMAKPTPQKKGRVCASVFLVTVLLAASVALAGSSQGEGLGRTFTVLVEGQVSREESIWAFTTEQGRVQLPEGEARQYLEAQGYEVQVKPGK